MLKKDSNHSTSISKYDSSLLQEESPNSSKKGKYSVPSPPPSPIGCGIEPRIIVDFSHFQYPVNMKALYQDNGIGDVIIKASQGMGADQYFKTYISQLCYSNAADSAILWGAYHFLNPEENGAQQAEFSMSLIANTLISECGASESNAYFVQFYLDIEDTPQYQVPAKTYYAPMIDFIKYMDAHINYQNTIYFSPGLYTRTKFFNQVCDEACCKKPESMPIHMTNLWLAEFGVKEPKALPYCFYEFQTWQYAEKVSLVGESAQFDLSCYTNSRYNISNKFHNNSLSLDNIYTDNGIKDMQKISNPSSLKNQTNRINSPINAIGASISIISGLLFCITI